MIVDHFRGIGTKFDKVVGVPNSGIPLATSVAERLNIPLAPGRKGKDFPVTWKTPVIVKEETPSFTTGAKSTFVFNGLGENDTVLVVEDVIALGTTMELVVRALRKSSINVSFATYFSKLFQGGEKRIREMGVETFSVISVEKLYCKNGEWKLKLAPPHFR